MEKPKRIKEEEYDALSKDEQKTVDEKREEWANFLSNESREDRFLRIIKPRLKKAFDGLIGIEKMVKSPAYKIEFDTLNSICEHLYTQIDSIKEAHNPKKEEKADNIIDSIFS